MSSTWPELPYDAWSATRDTLHAHTQVLGKFAVVLAPPQPQLQHAALRLTARGWETAPLPAPGRLVDRSMLAVSPAHAPMRARGETGPAREGKGVDRVRAGWSTEACSPFRAHARAYARAAGPPGERVSEPIACWVDRSTFAFLMRTCRRLAQNWRPPTSRAIFPADDSGRARGERHRACLPCAHFGYERASIREDSAAGVFRARLRGLRRGSLSTQYPSN
jgi:hypothetical protein